MAPAYPLPFEVPVTSMMSPAWKISALITAPTSSDANSLLSASKRISRTKRLGAVLAFHVPDFRLVT